MDKEENGLVGFWAQSSAQVEALGGFNPGSSFGSHPLPILVNGSIYSLENLFHTHITDTHRGGGGGGGRDANSIY